MRSTRTLSEFLHTRALDDILGTNETRIKLSWSICSLRPGEPDLGKLKETALGVHRRWVESELA